MAKTIVVSNQKGGVGKTTATSSLASALTSKGYKVLLINLDPQRNLDQVAGRGVVIPRNDQNEKSILSVLRGECHLKDAIVKTQIGDLVRAHSALSEWTGRKLITVDEFSGRSAEEVYSLIQSRINKGWTIDDVEILNSELAEVLDDYDFCLIDTNPSLQILTLSALYASKYVLVPCFPEASSRDAISELFDTIKGIQYYHPEKDLRVAGLLITKWVPRSISGKAYTPVLEKLAAQMDSVLFKTKIRRCISVNEYMTSSEDLLRYDPSGNASQDYLEFVDEFLARIDYLEKERTNG